MFKILNVIKTLKNLDDNLPVYLCAHSAPDEDAINSCIGIKTALEYLKKDCYILLDSKDTKILSWQKNKVQTVDKVTHQKYNFIALDLNETSRLGKFENYFKNAQITINIDHHSGNKTNATFVFSDPKSSSTCEIVYLIINSLNKKLFTNNLCSSLYAGIMTDTNCFSRRIGKKTLQIAQKLINNGIDYSYINKQTLWKRTKEELLSVGKLVEIIKQEENFSYVVVDQSIYPFNTLTLNDLTKKIAEDLRKLDFLDTFLFIVKHTDNQITTKVMTNSLLVADKIAEIFSGGGHQKEAGFTTNLSITQILLKTKQFLSQYK